MEIRCPHCDSAVEVAENHVLQETVLYNSREESVEGESAPKIGGYRIVAEIARGGMGIVYRAIQEQLGRSVALKLIRNGELASKEEVSRFQAEAQAAAQLDHPGIVPVFEVGFENDAHYFSMPLIVGESLRDRLSEGPLETREATRISKHIAEAVDYAHKMGVIHRDLKPGNVLIEQDGSVRVTDFGLAKRTECDSELTQTGQVLGTPSYMAPEQAKGEQVTERADVYSLGATLYCLLTGRPPFQAPTPTDTLIEVLNSEPVPPRKLNSRIPKDLETIALRCLEKEPQRRFGTARELAEELDRVLAEEPIRSRRIGLFQRAWRWVRRKPLMAGLSTGLLLLLCAAIGLGSYAAIEASSRRKADHFIENWALSRDSDMTEFKETALRTERERTIIERVKGYVREGKAHRDHGDFIKSLQSVETAMRILEESDFELEKMRHDLQSILDRARERAAKSDDG